MPILKLTKHEWYLKKIQKDFLKISL